MSSLRHFSNDLRHGIRNPPQNEKRGADVKLIEQSQRLQGILLDAMFESVPPSSLDDPLESGDLKVVFKGNRKYVLLRGCRKVLCHCLREEKKFIPY
jgi:hypothetical protein